MEKILISDSGQEKQKDGEEGRKAGGRGGGIETKKGKETPLVVCGMKTNVSKATFST